jgi:hypothetical protein
VDDREPDRFVSTGGLPPLFDAVGNSVKRWFAASLLSRSIGLDLFASRAAV